MLLPQSLLVLCLFLDLGYSYNSEEQLEDTFKARSDRDWEVVWHKEYHTRCRENLVRHLYWACEKDIYRLTRRDQKYESPFLSVVEAQLFLRERKSGRRRFNGGISDECCLGEVGCTWEEYAEYCPSNRRMRKLA